MGNSDKLVGHSTQSLLPELGDAIPSGAGQYSFGAFHSGLTDVAIDSLSYHTHCAQAL
jgi:hypothetical protein